MTDVLIVGSGPTGLTLACELTHRGVDVRIIDQSPGPHRASRGKTLRPDALRVFERWGAAERVRASCQVGLVLRKYFDGARISDTPTPDSLLFTGQWQIEEVLRERLAESGAHVEYGRRLTSITQDPDGVTARQTDGSEIRARYLAGCDGGHSTTRGLLGIPFEGRTEPERSMVVGDVTAPGLSREYWHQWFTSDGAGMMLCPIPGTRTFQIQASPERDGHGALIPPSLEGFQRLFDRHARMPGIRLAEPTWLSSWRVSVRMATRMREGRALLAGDAAHVHPIAGGLGMNTGIQDAAALGRALATALALPAGTAREKVLDGYGAERLPVAAELLLDTTARLERVLTAVREPGRGTETGWS